MKFQIPVLSRSRPIDSLILRVSREAPGEARYKKGTQHKMTNKERKAFQNFMNQMNAYSREVDEHREALTNMCRENGLPTYSNPRSCRDMLLTSDDATIR